MSARIDEDLYDLTWGDDPEPPRDTREHTPFDAELTGRGRRFWWVMAILAVGAAFAGGLLLGSMAGNAIAEDALTEAQAATVAAEDAAQFAAAWQERAQEASRSVSTLTSQTVEASAAIEALKEDLSKAQKAASAPKAVPQASTSVSRSGAVRAASTPAGSGVERWRPLVAKYFPASAVDEALYIISQESKGDPAAGSYNGCYGLFQVDALIHYHHYLEVDGHTADGNVYIASRLWAKSGNSFNEHWYSHTAYPRYSR